MRNLYLASVEVENVSGHDFENVDLKVYCGNDTNLLNETSAMVGTPYVVRWSSVFAASIHVAEGAEPTPTQWGIYNHSREYVVPVFNRGQLIQFTYLCTRPNHDDLPAVWVSTLLKGARLTFHARQTLTLGVPVPSAAIRGLVITLLAFVGCGMLVGNVWVASAIMMVVGLFAQIFGALEFKVERWFKGVMQG